MMERMTLMAAGMGLLSAAAAMLTPEAARANYCNYGAGGENQCPETTRSYHTLIITDLFGVEEGVTGNDYYTLGTWSGVMIACKSNTIYFLKDTVTDDYESTLVADSALCMGDGNDNVTVATSSFSCGGYTMSAFTYGSSRIMHIHGQAGNDTLTGGGHQDKLCGGSGGDNLDGGGDTDEVDGLSGADYVIGGTGAYDELYGYTGADCIYDGSGSGEFLKGEGDFDGCVWDNSSTFDTLSCGSSANDGYTRNSSGTTNCTYSTSGCDASCSF